MLPAWANRLIASSLINDYVPLIALMVGIADWCRSQTEGSSVASGKKGQILFFQQIGDFKMEGGGYAPINARSLLRSFGQLKERSIIFTWEPCIDQTLISAFTRSNEKKPPVY